MLVALRRALEAVCIKLRSPFYRPKFEIERSPNDIRRTLDDSDKCILATNALLERIDGAVNKNETEIADLRRSFNQLIERVDRTQTIFADELLKLRTKSASLPPGP